MPNNPKVMLVFFVFVCFFKSLFKYSKFILDLVDSLFDEWLNKQVTRHKKRIIFPLRVFSVNVVGFLGIFWELLLTFIL